MSRRTLKAAQAIREVVSMAILTEIKDPRVTDVTVTRVEVSGDMREAKVFITVMGSETKQQLCLRGLRSSAGFLQQKIGHRIETRYTPRIEFKLDKGEMNAAELAHVFKKIADEREEAEAALDDDGSETDATMPEQQEN
ncbi:MAG: 30S ribosome-binding factor RbfA [Pirellulales bacterium]|nr:30S ribosome-binding factor RbfA [Pirellulales bacterium]